MTEWLDVVDKNGAPTGQQVERERAHREGIRHRTAHVWLLRHHAGQTEILLQMRSKDKDSFPGCYDISSAGHIPAGESVTESALRELREELGLQARPEELILCGVRRFEYESVFHGRPFHDNQVSRVYALWRDVEPEALTLQKEEVERVDWMDYDRCVQGVSEGSFPNCIRMDELEMLKHAWAVDPGANCTNL